MKPQPSIAGPARPRGVSLIELMVGMAIGLLATLVIAQVTSLFEGQKRQTTSGSDAQLGAALALQTLLRDVQMGGYGLTVGGVAGCTEIRGQRGGTNYTWPMAPVIISQGSGANANETGLADSIQVLMSSNSGFAVPMRVRENHQRQGDTFVLDERINVGNRQGDLLLAVPSATAASAPSPAPTAQVSPNWCSLINISSAPTGDNIEHRTTNGPWNQDSTGTIFPGSSNTDISYAAGSYLLNLGALIDRCYFVAGSNQRCGLATATENPNALRVRNFNTSDGSTTNDEAFPDIINLQAVYGVDTSTPRDNTVDVWQTTTPTTSDGWSRVIAIRLAVVSRANQYNADEVTPTAPSWQPDGASTLRFTLPDCPSGEPSCWKHYRYRVFETIVPLRNMIWQARQP